MILSLLNNQTMKLFFYIISILILFPATLQAQKVSSLGLNRSQIDKIERTPDGVSYTLKQGVQLDKSIVNKYTWKKSNGKLEGIPKPGTTTESSLNGERDLVLIFECICAISGDGTGCLEVLRSDGSVSCEINNNSDPCGNKNAYCMEKFTFQARSRQ